MRDLDSELQAVDPGLRAVLLAIAEGVAGVAAALRTASVAEAGSSNALGDAQLVADLEADARVLAALRACPAVAVASSEEQPVDIPVHEGGAYSVAYDPLDGSSIVGADWAVGSIFAVFPGAGFVGRSGRDLVASAYAVHGPRTVLVVARPAAGASGPPVAQEFVWNSAGWALAADADALALAPSKKVFAPANLRAAAENPAYDALVKDVWMAGRYTLRYSGGMVPDVHHMLAKGGGVFCFPAAPGAPPKLRVLYEVLPLAHAVEAAGGASLAGGGGGSALDLRLGGHDDRATVCLGSPEEVARCRAAMAWSAGGGE